MIDAALAELGGFPVIIKSMGGMHGVGVMKIDSRESFSSIIDYLQTKDDTFILRQFIEHSEQARIVVLGDQVISSHANMTSGDFRTNAGEEKNRQRENKSYSNEIQDIAVQAVRSLGLEFGGVDIIFDTKTGEPFITEVNFPFFFPGNYRVTGAPIAKMMIEYLVEKSKNN